MALTKNSYLKAMGIDVWTSRPATPQPIPEVPRKPTESAAPVVLKAKQASQAARQILEAPGLPVIHAEVNRTVPEFLLALFHYETMGICLSLRSESELPKRFCDDVARTMGANIESVRYQLLQWPMLSTSGIDQSIKAAREVVTQKFSQMPARVVVFGSDVIEYYHPLGDLAPMSPGVVGARSFLLVPSLKAVLGSGAAKRELMLAMHQWRAG